MRYFLASTLSVLLLLACKKDLAPIQYENIRLSVASAEVTEVWLKLNNLSGEPGLNYVVKRDTHIVYNGIIADSDTLIHDTNLNPNQSYTYRAYIQSGGQKRALSELTTTTMDTTSHDFEWQVFEFGDHSSSYFSDAAIINENDIWCVGKIYTDSGDFNAAHWDGDKWKLKKIPAVTYWGSISNGPILSVFAFSTNDLWMFSQAGSYVHWDGKVWKSEFIEQRQGSIYKIWGTSSENLYFVGSNGNITYYNGQTWQKLDSGTDVDINDIWGRYDDQTGEQYILCAASSKYDVSAYKLLQINEDKSVSEKEWPFPDRTPYTVWFHDKNNIFIAGEGIRMSNRLGRWKEFTDVSNYFKNKIRGNDINDIYITGDFGLIAHYNGLTWWVQPDIFSGAYDSISINDDVIIAVGECGRKARIIKIRKSN